MLKTVCLLLLLGEGAAAAERISFSVLDKAEKPVLGLTAAEFTLRINGWPTPLQDFQPGQPSNDRSVPLVAWILLDSNPNINAAMVGNQAGAAAGFFQMLHPASAVGVRLISDRMETLAPLGREPEAVRNAFTDFSRHRNELRVRKNDNSEFLGPGGLLRAIEISMGDMESYLAAEPTLRDQRVRRAILLISDANVNPSYYKRSLFEEAARRDIHFYPIFVPRRSYGSWIEQFFDLAKNTAGLAATFGAINPGSDAMHLPRENKDPNALTFNFLNIVRDLNGKYSCASPQALGKLKLELKQSRKDVQIRLARKTLP